MTSAISPLATLTPFSEPYDLSILSHHLSSRHDTTLKPSATVNP